MKKFFVLMIAGLLVSAVLAGCGNKADDDTAKNYSEMAEQIVQFINNKEYDKITEQFDTNMKANLPAEQLAQIEPVIAQSGDFEKIEKQTVEEKDGMKIVVLVAQYSEEKRIFTLTYDSEDKIAGLFIK